MSIILRLEIDKSLAHFGGILSSISAAGGDIVAIDVIKVSKQRTVRDITVNVYDQAHAQQVVDVVSRLAGVKLINVSDRTFLVHLGGKLEVQPKMPIKNREELSRVYTPGVARVCQAIAEDPSKAFSLTIKRNTVAVVSDGSAVLGLGDVGPYAAMPVMEGKAMLFKQLAGVDAFPICLDTKDTEEIIRIVKAIAPAFGGINLEDISAPRCFEIEERLKEELDIPVFHDDQHGTAVVMLAGLLNALKLVGKRLDEIKVVVCGIGAAGTACTKMLLSAGVQNIIGVDRDGAIVRGKRYDNPMWNWYAERTNPDNVSGSLSDVIEGATCSSASPRRACSRWRTSRRWPATRSSLPWPIPSRRLIRRKRNRTCASSPPAAPICRIRSTTCCASRAFSAVPSTAAPARSTRR